MQIIDYVDLYLAALLNIMFTAILISKVFDVKMIKTKSRRIIVLLFPSLLVAIINLLNKDVFKVSVYLV